MEKTKVKILSVHDDGEYKSVSVRLQGAEAATSFIVPFDTDLAAIEGKQAYIITDENGAIIVEPIPTLREKIFRK